MEVNWVNQLSGYQHSLKYIILCLAEKRNLYRFRKAWGE